MKLTNLVGAAGIAGCMTLIVLWVIALPLAAIWAGNRLFAFEIEFSFWNWVAAAILCVIIYGNSNSSSKS